MENLLDGIEEESLKSILDIVNAEARQRQLEGVDDYFPGHPMGICCDNCQGKKFTTFGITREKRRNAPGFITLVYMHCETCGEMIFLVCQSTCFVPDGLAHYRPHWNILEPTNKQIQQASLHHLKCLEDEAEKQVKELIDWM